MTKIEQPFLKNALAGVMALEPYSPGMPIDELQRRLGLSDVIKLASNENPLGPSPQVKAALAEHAASGNVSLYPDGGGFRLKKKIAEFHGIEAERITLGNGSNDLLEFIARVFLGPGRKALFSEYCFAVYPLATLAQNAEAIVAKALPSDHPTMPYGHDLDAFAAALTPEVSVVMIANPNNPTGTWVEAAPLEAFIAQVPASTLIVLDEAYIEYFEPGLAPASRAWLDRYPNLVITRTFSKTYGLAGLRAGYALSHPSVADLLNRVRQPFNLNMLALLAAEVALGDQAHVAEAVELNRSEMARLKAEFDALGLKTLPSQANFLTFDLGREAAPIHKGLLERGVIVRPMASYQMPTYLRVSIGTNAENTRFLAALKEVLAA
ncbi:histidinol-phosphate transaminase [Nevskia ramosa]|uniref:histidinol-phosphate transaminase n=1 Tax=Nevskia ramosa TaxID=64002 RepID=UPI0003B616C3|nr:histidinol-phosphate transaminase [Nevskia ramosa]